MLREITLGVVTLLATGFVPVTSYAQTREEVIEIIRDAATRHGVDDEWLVRVVSCETGGTFNPGAVGDRGASIGLAQLHVRGLRPLFYQQGYSDPLNAWEAADFMARSFAAGLARHWTCARR